MYPCVYSHRALYMDWNVIVRINIYSYAEAHKIKLKSDALEAWELEKWHSTRQQELLQREGS